MWSTRHFSLFPLRKKENDATAGSAVLCSFLKKKKKRDGCYLTQSLVTLVPWLLWNTELFNDANYKQRENIRRVCLEISLLDWKLASLIELAGLRFSLWKPGLVLWSICIISLPSGSLGIVENWRQENLSSIYMAEMSKWPLEFLIKALHFPKKCYIQYLQKVNPEKLSSGSISTVPKMLSQIILSSWRTRMNHICVVT